MKGGINKLAILSSYNFKLRKVSGMKIERITIHGFRNISNTSLYLKNISALVSLNSFGKSNLLSAIHFGISFITDDSKAKQMRWIPGIPMNKKLAGEDFKFELEMTTNTELDKFSIIYGYQFKWVRNDDSGARILSEWLKVKKNKKGQKYSRYIIRKNQKAKYKKAESGRCDHPILVDSSELVINKLQAYDSLFFLDLVKRINNLTAHIEEHLDAGVAYQPYPFIRTDLEALQIDNINNLPRVIFYLREQAREKHDLLINSYKKLFPQIEKIEVDKANFNENINFQFPDDVPLRITNEIFILRVSDKNLNQPINFEAMSDGAKRILLLLTCVILSDINKCSLIEIEEPDNCIHPRLLGQLLDIMGQLTNDCRILITSHSPYLIKFFEPENLYIGLPSSDGVAQFLRISSSGKKALNKDAQESKQSIGDHIFQLMSGSEDDIKELKKYLECESK
jgi:predicted ATPase